MRKPLAQVPASRSFPAFPWVPTWGPSSPRLPTLPLPGPQILFIKPLLFPFVCTWLFPFAHGPLHVHTTLWKPWLFLSQLPRPFRSHRPSS